MVKDWLKHNFLYLLGATMGAIAGYVYWREIGCVSGTCPITSKPLNSTLYGSMMGALLFGLFVKDKKQQD